MSSRLTPRTCLACLVIAPLLAPVALHAQSVDDSALRYYTLHNQPDRAEAEARRLTSIYPGWVVPKDIATARPNQPDETPLWALFSSADALALTRAIEARRLAEPGWQPSDDLVSKIRQRDIRAVILARATTQDWSDVATFGTGYDKTGDVDDLALSWAVAEGLARSERQPEALAVFQAILQRRSDAGERYATVQKSLALLPVDDVETLLKTGRPRADGLSEFADLAIDVTRARIAARLQDDSTAALDLAEAKRFETYAGASADPVDAALIAWLALRQNRTNDALVWFKTAMSRGGDAMVAHGLATTLLRLGMKREAEEVAFAWREPLINNLILYIDVQEVELTRSQPPAIEPERLTRYAKVTMEARSGEGAQALGWYAYNTCQFDTALGWFQRASAWFPKEGTIFGQALTLKRLKRQRDFIELVNRYDGLFPRIVELVFNTGQGDGIGPCERPVVRPGQAENDYIAMQIPRVPSPVGAATNSFPVEIKRADFPIAVLAENPLRFPDASTWRSAPDDWRRNAREAQPLVARRVIGVAAMPYERLGFSLLPAWNGQTEASDNPETERRAPRGTLWSAEANAAPPSLATRNSPSTDTTTNTSAAQRFKR